MKVKTIRLMQWIAQSFIDASMVINLHFSVH